MENIYRIFNKIKSKSVVLLGHASKRPIYYVAIASSVYLVRAFQYIAHPQLYAEDGAVWLSDGYSIGVKSLTLPLNGLFHFPERLFGFLVAHLPLALAPFIFNITALLIFSLVTYYIFSSRTQILRSNFEKIFVVISLSLIANIDELFFNFSNSMFLLGIVGLLIFVAKNSKNKWISYAEKGLFLLTCFTLPFSWFYVLFAIFERLKYKKKELFFLLASLAGALTQLGFYLTAKSERSPVTLISLVSKYTVLEIYNQIIVPSIRFARLDAASSISNIFLIPLVIFSILISVGALLFVLWRANKQTRYLLIFLLAMTLASLKSPFVSSPTALGAIKFMSTASGGDRYFVFGIIGLSIVFAKVLSSLIKNNYRILFLSIFLIFGLFSSLHYKSFFIEKNFTDYTKEYRSGIRNIKSVNQQDIQIPVNPGPGWKIQFTKKGTPNPNY